MPPADRYARQIAYPPLGPEAQKLLASKRLTIIGCGALGSHLAQSLTRAGVGFIRIIDRDFLEISNLQRQTLFTEEDINNNLPKAQAAAQHLRRINSTINIEPIVADVNHESIKFFVEGADLILDGTDNMLTRFLINDIAVSYKTPWLHAACLGAAGQTMAIVPPYPPCLQCLLEALPEPGQMQTCETAGIIEPAVAFVAALQTAQALKILTNNLDALNRNLISFDLWQNHYHETPLDNLKDGCPCCRDGDYNYLAGKGSLSD